MLNEHTRRTRQGGFTLIELVIVIIILGILAAVAVPQFIDLSNEAEDAALNAQASSLSAANSLNVAACALDTDDCEVITECSEASTLVQNFDDDQYNIVSDGSGTPFALTNTTGEEVGDPIEDCGVELAS